MLDIVILAAGKGTRMKTNQTKALHPIAGLPLLQHVLAIARGKRLKVTGRRKLTKQI